ncbi:MAG TPA: PQQ-binding-like beta-propeller repeat protein [Verrucomicrobiae bacterium]|nr:PQQ-binding-like beta-propeller repeat protein [Verrucomicrobiae bacterium]
MNHASVLLACALLSGNALPAQDLNWPEFRGPRGDGVTTSEHLPLHWDRQASNHVVKWTVPIHGKAWSSPVVWGEKLWLTSATEDGRELFVLCVDKQSGKILRDDKLFDVAKPQYCIPFNSYASPTPAAENGRVYVTFGAAGTAALDASNGKVLWTRRDFECNHFRGPGSSPILHGNLLFLNFDGSDFQYVVALDKETGRTIWKTARTIDYKDLGLDGKPENDGDLRKAFATCQILTDAGRTELLSQGSKAIYAYDAATGAELWKVKDYSSYSGCTRPVLGHGLVFVPAGFPNGEVLAIRPGKPGDELDVKDETTSASQLQIAWKDKHHAPKKPSLLLIDDVLYAVDDNGVVSCWEAGSGKMIWSERIGGHFTASPLGAPGRIYLFSEEGKTTVLATGREFKKLAENELGDGFMASPAVSGQALFLRSKSALYRLEDQERVP